MGGQERGVKVVLLEWAEEERAGQESTKKWEWVVEGRSRREKGKYGLSQTLELNSLTAKP